MPKFMPLPFIAAAILLAGPVLAQSGGGVSGDGKAPDVTGGYSREAPEAGSDQAVPDDGQSAERQDEGDEQERKGEDLGREGVAIGKPGADGEGPGAFQLNHGELPLGGNARGTSKGDPSGGNTWPSR